jgi:hypothetical protein
MSVSNLSVPPVTVIAGSAISLYRYLELNAAGKFDHADGAQGPVMGVSDDAAAADLDALGMRLMVGIAKVEAGAAVTRGTAQATDTVGRTINHVSGAGNSITGYAMDAASGAGEIIRVLLLPQQDGLL